MEFVTGHVELGITDDDMSGEFSGVAGILKGSSIITLDDRSRILGAFAARGGSEGIQIETSAAGATLVAGIRQWSEALSADSCDRSRYCQDQEKAEAWEFTARHHGSSEGAPFWKEA
jgi:hypothetical protein